MKGRFVVVGDALLDRDVQGNAERLCPDAPVPVLDETDRVSRPGGAALAAVLACADGRRVTLVTAMADDGAGLELAGLLEDAGVEVVAAPLANGTPEKIRLRSQGQSLLRLDRNAAPGAIGRFPAGAEEAIAEAAAVLVSDYGRGVTADAALRDRLAAFRGPKVWDPHPKGAPPVAGMSLVTPNRSELRVWFPESADNHQPDSAAPGEEREGLATLAARTRRARARWAAHGVAVTLGADGALLVAGDGAPLRVPAQRVDAADPCGAGDRFAVSAAGCLSDGALISEAVTEAVRSATRFVGGHSARAWWRPAAEVAEVGEWAERLEGTRGPARRPGSSGAADAYELARSARAGGETLVVAGGCFDLLHAGHVALLEAARRLGDRLIVAVNSDASVTELKGPGRPLVPQADRVAVLAALGCVDAVVVFDEPSPIGVLELLRPHLFVKGGDYADRQLPESAVLARWGGQAVVVPYLSGRSTTSLLRQAAGAAP